MTKLGRPTDKRKDKTVSFRATEKFIDEMDDLANAFGMNRTELIEHLVEYYPYLASLEGDKEC